MQGPGFIDCCLKIHKMLVRLLILFPISLTLCCKSAPIQGENTGVRYVLDGEPIFVQCPLVSFHGPMISNFDISWFRNGSELEMSRDTQARVHQANNMLRFIPARLEDSGSYTCVLRNQTVCWKKTQKLDVFQNTNGLCYKSEALYDQGKLPKAIHCKDVIEYIDIKSAHFQWFKDCEPLRSTNADKYTFTEDKLMIPKATKHEGIYTCETSFTYNGTNYKLSRSINYSDLVRPVMEKPVILHPTGNFLEAKLGASVTLNCQALYSKGMSIYWSYNSSHIKRYSNDKRVIEGHQYKTMTKDGKKVISRNISFSNIKKEDYDKTFYCHVASGANAKASVTLKRPDPNFQPFVIALFLASVSLIITTIITIKVFKVQIVLWYRSSCFFHPRHNDGKTYDAYVMCSKKNTGISAYDMDFFVFKVLPEVLEQQCNYRLFIIGRDDIPGQGVADVVDEAISQSRRLIIVLGNISKEDYGEDFEQKTVMHDALIRNQLKVILIELEKITDYSSMPESITYIKQKQGVVRWKQEFTEASLSPNTRFWKNVRYRMPPPSRHSDSELRTISTEDERPGPD